MSLIGGSLTCSLLKEGSPHTGCQLREHQGSQSHTLLTGGSEGSPAAGQAAPQHRHTPRPWLQAGAAANAATKRLRSVLRSRGQAGACLCLRLDRAPLAVSQSSSPSPGKPKLLCSISKGDTHTHSLTHTDMDRGRHEGKVPGEGASSVHTAWGPCQQQSRAKSLRPALGGAAGMPQGPKHAERGCKGGPGTEGCDMP